MGICPSAIPQLQGNTNYAIDSPVTKRAFSTYLFQSGFFFFYVFIFNRVSNKLIYSACVCQYHNILQYSGMIATALRKANKCITSTRFPATVPKFQMCTADKGCLLSQWNNEDNKGRLEHFGWGKLQEHHTRAHSHCCCKLLAKVFKVHSLQTTGLTSFPIYKSTTINPVTYLVQPVKELGENKIKCTRKKKKIWSVFQNGNILPFPSSLQWSKSNSSALATVVQLLRRVCTHS